MRDQFSHRLTTPADCSLGVALPTTCHEFDDGLRPGADKDFARTLLDRTRHNPYSTAQMFWKVIYEPSAGRIMEVIREVRRRGVLVQSPCSLSNLHQLFDRQVVTLVAHWRSSRVLPRDLRDVPALARRLADPGDEVASRVRDHLPPDTPGLIRAGGPPEDDPSDRLRAALARALNAVIDDQAIEQNLPSNGSQSGLKMLLRAHNRSVLDRSFAGLIIPGNRVELSDGLHPIEAIIGQVPLSFSGIIDLTVCNSILLGEAIKQQRPNCLVVMNLKTTDLDLRVVVYRHLIRYLSRFPKNYIDALADLRIGVIQQRSRLR